MKHRFTALRDKLTESIKFNNSQPLTTLNLRNLLNYVLDDELNELNSHNYKEARTFQDNTQLMNRVFTLERENRILEVHLTEWKTKYEYIKDKYNSVMVDLEDTKLPKGGASVIKSKLRETIDYIDSLSK